VNRSEFQELVEVRLADADTLIKQGRYDAAYYLAGYAVECALKACIAKQTAEHDFPPRNAAEFYQHDLGKLMQRAVLGRQWLDEVEADEELGFNWDVVKAWSEQSRYERTRTEKEAKDIYSAIQDPEHGVLACLRRLW
jgi:HEPN domain-containing protein